MLGNLVIFLLKVAAIIGGIILAVFILSMIVGSLELRFGAGSRKIKSEEDEDEEEEDWEDEED